MYGITVKDDYHLPADAYWVCNSNYNGLSQLAKFSTDVSIMRSARRGKLKNLSFPSKIRKQLA